MVGAGSLHHGARAVLCSTALLRRHGMALGDVGLWGLNEAFAAQVLACLAAWQDPPFCRDVLVLTMQPLDCAHSSSSMAAPSGWPSRGRERQRIVLHLVNAIKRLDIKQGIATKCMAAARLAPC